MHPATANAKHYDLSNPTFHLQMDDFQEPAERPAVVSREHVLRMLGSIFVKNCPDAIRSALIDYLERKGVLLRDRDSYSIPGAPEALSEFPDDAQRYLHIAILNHAQSSACPRVLRNVIAGHPAGGHQETNQVGPLQQADSLHRLSLVPKIVERIRWDRQGHLQELADFGPQASAILDWIVESLVPDSRPASTTAGNRQRQEKERARQHQERRAARRKETDQAIADADVPTLARFWHTAVERLCEPSGNPTDEHLHVFWVTSHKLAVAAETLARPRRSLLALRGATTGLPGDVGLVQRFFAANPQFVRLRQQAAAEVSEVLVAHELQAHRGATRQPASPDHEEQPRGLTAVVAKTTITQAMLALQTVLHPEARGHVRADALCLRTVATSQDGLAKAVRQAAQQLEHLADRATTVNLPPVTFSALTKSFTATSGIAAVHYLCTAVFRMSVQLVTRPEDDADTLAATLGADLGAKKLDGIKTRALLELDLLREAEASDQDVSTPTNSPPSIEEPTTSSAEADTAHWVPASSLVNQSDERFGTPAKIKAFCKKHGIPNRPGVTKDGKPWKQRCDVQLEAWNAKVAALEVEQRRLQDAADNRTADRRQFRDWARDDEDDSK